MNVMIALAAIGVVGWFILKNYKPQVILIAAGLVLMILSNILGYKSGFVTPQHSTGWVYFDMFEYINQLTIRDTAGLGLMIMAVTGFAKYMDHIGASAALVHMAMKPLQRLNAPYVVMSLSFLLCMFMALFIPSASGLAMLMMVTIFPILLKLGISRLGAVSVVGTGHLLDIGPASASTLLVSKTAGLNINSYFMEYQLPVYVICGISAAIAHYFWQKYLDDKERARFTEDREFTAVVSEKQMEGMAPPGPLPYTLLPILPLVFLLGFSQFGIKGIKMNVTLAMFLSLTISMGCELIRHRGNARKVCGSIQYFLKGMGDQFTNTVSLIVAGETFAYGLECIGLIDSMVKFTDGLSISGPVIVVGTAMIIVGLSMVMGGIAAIFAFAPLVPNVAKGLCTNPVTMLLSLQNASCLGRLLSPISPVMIAVAGIANVSTIDIVKRNSVPVLVALAVSNIAIVVLHL